MRTIVKFVVVMGMLGAVFYGLVVALDPWALQIGGRSTPLLFWTGMGTLHAKDGKSYPLYVYFHPSTGASRLRKNGLRSNSGLKGTAEICKAPGVTELLQLSGTMWGGYSSTEGSLVDLRLFEWKVVDPQMRKGYFDLAGVWHGGDLTMDEPGMQGRAFLDGLHIEGATAAFEWADHTAFAAACRADGSGGR